MASFDQVGWHSGGTNFPKDIPWENGATHIGMGDQIGSLKAGKLADLIILEKNPLENIQNTEFVEYTMINGRLYDAKTMNEIGNREKPRNSFYWESDKYGENFKFHESTNSFEQPKCLCGRH